MPRLWVVIAVSMLPGCVLSPIDPSGRACDADDRCAEGWVCRLADRLCVPLGADAALPDGGGADAAIVDVGPLDAPPIDAPGSDGGALADASDAALPVCTPACHPLAERCTFDGCELDEYVPGTRSPVASPRIVRLDSVIDSAELEIDLTTSVMGVAIGEVDVVLVRPRRMGGPVYDRCRFVLPNRTPERPLVIAASMGPVRCTVGEMVGGTHWVLTGRYDAASGIGDPSTPGHTTGYADTRGRYGFEFLGELAVHPSTDGSEAHFEIEFVELSGLVPSTLGGQLVVQGGAGLVTALLHDNYLHDATGTALSAAPNGGFGALAVYRNRILRAGGPCARLADVGDGTLVRNDVLAACNLALRRDTWSFQGDTALFIEGTGGRVRVEDLVMVGSHGEALRLNDGGAAGATATRFELENVIADGVGAWPIRFTTTLDEADFDAALVVRSSRFHDLVWRYDAVDAAAATTTLVELGVRGTSTVALFDVDWSAGAILDPYPLDYLAGTSSDSGPTTVAPIELADFMGTVDPMTLETWHASFCRPTAGPTGLCDAPMSRAFVSGDVVVHEGALYRATRATTASDVPGVSSAWSEITPPVDDVRLRAGSVHAATGAGL